MDAVIPRGSALPHPGRAVRLLVGNPVLVADLLRAAEEQAWSDDRLYVAIADRIGSRLHALKAQLDNVPLSEVLDLLSKTVPKSVLQFRESVAM